ncbi:TasA family protein [Acetoanaerobium noterae]|uniref:TasA family protein n=1 Tax=Acetoanaerobium noterae TaxID=745369 RepID=UPI00324248EC
MLQRKMLMSIASVLVLVALIAGATMAWFTDSETVAATFTAGTVDVGITDPLDLPIVNPGDKINFGAEKDLGYYHNAGGDGIAPQGGYDRMLKIQYTGSKAAYVRVLVDATWANQLPNTNLSMTDVAGDNWEYKGLIDGKHVFQLNGILNGSVEKIGDYEIGAVENVPFILNIDGATTGNEYQGKGLLMNVEVQAVQAANVDPSAIPFETVTPAP